MLFWGEADFGVTKDGSDKVSFLADQGGLSHDVTGDTVGDHTKPTWQDAIINGLPSIHFASTDILFRTGVGANLLNQGDPRTVLAVIKPDGNNDIGSILTFRQSTSFFACDMWLTAGVQYAYDDGFATNIPLTAVVDYTNTPILIDWVSDGANLQVAVGGVNRAQTSSALGPENGLGTGFSLGRKNTEVFGGPGPKWISAWLVYAGNDAPTLAAARAYLQAKYAV